MNGLIKGFLTGCVYWTLAVALAEPSAEQKAHQAAQYQALFAIANEVEDAQQANQLAKMVLEADVKSTQDQDHINDWRTHLIDVKIAGRYAAKEQYDRMASDLCGRVFNASHDSIDRFMTRMGKPHRGGQEGLATAAFDEMMLVNTNLTEEHKKHTLGFYANIFSFMEEHKEELTCRVKGGKKVNMLYHVTYGGKYNLLKRMAFQLHRLKAVSYTHLTLPTTSRV